MNETRLRKMTRAAIRHSISLGDGLVLRRQESKQWYWSLRYRASGVQRRMTLGRYPRLSLSDARLTASRVLRQVDLGGDPQAAQRAARAAAAAERRNSIEALAAAYLAWAREHKRSWDRDQTMLTREILPKWRGRAVASITRRDCKDLVRAKWQHGPTYATSIARLLSKMMNWAVDEEWIETSPATRIIPRQPRDADHETRQAYTPDEIRLIWRNTERLLPIERVPIRLGLLTGQRPTEISDLQWDEISGSWWRIPGARAKNGRPHRVYLAQAALDELAEVPRDRSANRRTEPERYVFASSRGPKRLGAINVHAFAGVREREKPRHALRHTVGTGMASIGVTRDDRAKVLNHTDQSVTGIYDEHDYDGEKRLALMKWARRLAQILDR